MAFRLQPSPQLTRIALIALFMLFVALILWWAAYFFSMNQTIYDLKKQQLQSEDTQSLVSIQIEREFRSRKIMVLSEGFVFLVTVFLLWGFILRSVTREGELHELQRNLISRVSHEFNTPISSLRLYLETLERGDWPQDRKNQFIKTMKGELLRLQALVESVLNYARSKHEVTENKISQLEVFDFLKSYESNAVQKFQLNFEEKLVPIAFQVGSELSGVQVIASNGGMKIVLDNLLSNALKYGRGKEVKVSAIKKGGVVEIKVQDQGMGFHEEDERKLFQPFTRFNEDTPGTGLGLSIVSELVHSWGGDVSARSLGENLGAVFKVRVRVA